MSWDATLYAIPAGQRCPHCGGTIPSPRTERTSLGWWNYTHNTSIMIYDALKVAGIALADDESWWKHLNGMSGEGGSTYLSAIITQLEAEPGKYTQMNPLNGWGDYDGLLGVLREMRDATPGEAAEWHVSG